MNNEALTEELQHYMQRAIDAELAADAARAEADSARRTITHLRKQLAISGDTERHLRQMLDNQKGEP